jgi:TetR/AcrR family transcriptional regulator
MPKDSTKPVQNSRIQNQNKALILDAALEEFSAAGFRGATIDKIAARCGLSKPNLLYYFKGKEDLYHAVLERTLEGWLEPLASLDPQGDPETELTGYIAAKLELSFTQPAQSRLFANEIMHGAPVIGKFLTTELKDRLNKKASVINQWIADGKIAETDPYHFIFAIWAVTQHYADFSVQVEALLGKEPDHAETRTIVTRILLAHLKRS